MRMGESIIIENFEIEFQKITNIYTDSLTNIQNQISANIDNYNNDRVFNLCNKIKMDIFLLISAEYCAKDRALFLYSQLVKNIRSCKLKSIIYLISQNCEKAYIKKLLNIPEKNFNTYLNRIGGYLTKNDFVIKYYINNESKTNIFFKEDGNLINVYDFIKNLFRNP